MHIQSHWNANRKCIGVSFCCLARVGCLTFISVFYVEPLLVWHELVYFEQADRWRGAGGEHRATGSIKHVRRSTAQLPLNLQPSWWMDLSRYDEIKTLFLCNCACPVNRQEQCFKNCADNLMKVTNSIFSQCLFLPAPIHTKCNLVLKHAGAVFRKLEILAVKRQSNRAAQIVSLKQTACLLAGELELEKTTYHRNWWSQMPLFCDSHSAHLEVSSPTN